MARPTGFARAGAIALDLSMAQPSIDMCDDARLVVIDDATKCVQHDAVDRVDVLLLESLARFLLTLAVWAVS